MESISISVIDAIIIVVYLVFIIWWGLRHGKSSDAGSYFLAGRTMPWWVVGLSLFAASISSTTLIGQSGDSYSTGIAVFNYNLTGVVVMVFFATFLLPLYIKSKIFTIPEFLEKRFDKRSRYYFSAICIIGNIFLDAAGALYAAALIIKLMFPAASLGLIIVIFAILAASYTIPGGLSSAINAELIQAVILIAGSVILTCACFANGGGEYLAGLLAADDTSVKLIRPLNDPSTPWLGLIIGMPVSGIYFWANNQTLVQRVLSAKSVDEGRKGVMFNGFLTLVTLFIIIIPGLVARHHFPVSEYPAMSTPDNVYPMMVLKLLPTGIIGVMLSALLAALTSTLSAILNSTSTLFTMDFYAKAHPEADSKHLVKVGKIAALAIIVIAAVWAPNIGRFGSLLKYYQEMLSYIAPPIVAAFLLGMFSKRVNADGAFTGLLTGLAMAVVMLFFRHRIFGDLHFLLIIPILLAFSMMAIYIASLFKPAPSAEKLADTTFRRADFRAETLALKSVPFYKNYRVWGAALLAACALILILFA
ncbi:MAG: sodium/solute symporter [Bacteroidales bacterium]|nr:sodium/solute symporter [Bacteroidales bacterium]